MRDPDGRFEATVWVRRRLRFERLIDDLVDGGPRADEPAAAVDRRERRRPA
jgi:hypothetical protein